MPKLDLTSARRMMLGIGEVSRMKGVGFAWRKPPIPTTILTVTGGVISEFRRDSVDYTQVLWRQSGGFVLSDDTDAQWVLVGGGGSGGSRDSGNSGQGGGGGGWPNQSTGRGTVPSGEYGITIGAGGAPSSLIGNDGSDSSVSGPLNITAPGGGGGGSPYDAASAPGRDGGNGGGGGAGTSDAIWDGGLGDPGNNGGTGFGSSTSGFRAGGGGGGAGAAGQNATSGTIGSGGTGITLTFTDADIYCGGGGDGCNSSAPPPADAQINGNGSHGNYGAPSSAGGDGLFVMVVRSDEVVVQ